jgi:hypothetical protein
MYNQKTLKIFIIKPKLELAVNVGADAKIWNFELLARE